MLRISLVLVVSIVSFEAYANGPTLGGVNNILNIQEKDGTWYPGPSGWLGGITAETKVKVLIEKDRKEVAWAIYEIKRWNDEGWAKMTNISEIWPGKANTPKTYLKLKPGEYSLSVYYGKKLVWRRGFAVRNMKLGSENHFRMSPSWKNLAYFHTSSGRTGARICAWLTAPDDKKWFPKKYNRERTFVMAADVKRDGKVLVGGKDPSGGTGVKLHPGETVLACCSISYESEFKEKVLNKDGEIEVTMYNRYGGLHPVAKLKVQVKDGKIVLNASLTGKMVGPETRINTTNAYYGENLIKGLEHIPASK